MRTCYVHPMTRSIVDLIPPGELFPGWTISRVSVLPEHRGRGWGRLLLSQVIYEADSEGALLFLTIQPDASDTGLNFDQLHSWYSRLGFQPSRLGYPAMIRIPSVMGVQSEVKATKKFLSKEYGYGQV